MTIDMMKQPFTYMQHLHADQFETFCLEPLDDIADDAPLHSIRLDGNEGAFLKLSHDSENKTGKKRKNAKQ